MAKRKTGKRPQGRKAKPAGVALVQAFGRFDLEIPITDQNQRIGWGSARALVAFAGLTPAEAFRIGFALIEFARHSPGFGEG